MKAFLVRRWFLLTLAAALSAGFLGSARLLPLAGSAALRYSIVASVLFLMALPLEASVMWRTIRRPGPPLLGVAMNIVVLPLLTWLVVTATGDWLLSRDMGLGLLVAAAIPCTLASAAVWTRRAGGNDSVSIMVTVITNATCFLVTPFWLLQTTGKATEIDATQMIVKLALFVVLPMTVAQCVRLARPIGRWATCNTVPLSVIAQLGILSMVFLGAIQTGQRVAASGNRPILLEVIVVLLCVIAIHVTILVCGMLISRLMGMDRREQIAVGFAGSQKTLMIGLQVSMELGFNIIPMVAYHVSQLFVDTLIADRLRCSAAASGREQES